MKKLCVALFAVAFFGLSVFSQTSRKEIEQLRKEVGLPVSAVISESSIAFPNAKDVKIFLAIKHNSDAAKDFRKWVDKWNKNNSSQYGRLEIVQTIDDADIVAAQFQFGVARRVQEESVQMKIGKVPNRKDDDRFVLADAGNSTIRAERAIKTLPLPLYTYLMTRGQNSAWNLDYSRVDDRVPSDAPFPEKLLQSRLESRLKDR